MENYDLFSKYFVHAYAEKENPTGLEQLMSLRSDTQLLQSLIALFGPYHICYESFLCIVVSLMWFFRSIMA